MGKYISILMAVLLVLLSVSCINIKPRIVYTTTLRVPVIATSVDLPGILEEHIRDLAEGLDLSILDGTPVVLRISTVLYATSVNDFEDLFPDSSLTILSWKENVPIFQELEMNLDLETPTFPNVKRDVHVMLPPESTLNISTKLVLETGISSSDIEALTLNGEILIAVSMPSNWKNVDFMGMEVILSDGEGEVLVSAETDSQDLTLKLSHSHSDTGNGEFLVHMSVLLKNSGPPVDGNLRIYVYPDLEIEELHDAHVEIEHAVELEYPIKELSFEEGILTFHSEQLRFENVTGTIQSRDSIKSLRVSNGDVISDLNGLSLPATLTIESLTASVIGDLENVRITGSIEDARVRRVVLYAPGLDFKNSHTYTLPMDEAEIERMTFSRGTVSIDYEIDFPINVRLRSDNFDPPLDENLTLNPEFSEHSFDISGTSLKFQNNSFQIVYEASPENYDGENLVLEDLEMEDMVSLSATMNVRDIDISEIVLRDLSSRFSGEFDLSEFDPLFLNLMKSLKTISASVIVNSPMEGNLVITTHTVGDSDFKVSLKEGENGLPWARDMLITVLSATENSVRYDLSLDIERVVLDTEGLEIGLIADIPIDFSIPSSVVILDVSTVVRIDLKDLESFIDCATLTIEGKNENLLRPVVSIHLNGRTVSEFVMDENFIETLNLNRTEIQTLVQEGLPVDVKVFLSGDQMLSPGGLDIRVKLQARITLKTGGAER